MFLEQEVHILNSSSEGAGISKARSILPLLGLPRFPVSEWAWEMHDSDSFFLPFFSWFHVLQHC